MADKISTLILKVDLDCRQCYKKIRKILCKLQGEERIRTISYDDGSKTIVVAGPFDPHKLSCRIRCMGGKVIKGIDIMHDGDDRKKRKEKPKEIEPPPAPPPDSHISAAMPVMIEEMKPRERPVDVTPTTVEIPSLPAQPVPAAGPGRHCGCSCCRPCYRGYHDGCRCCSCVRVYGYSVSILPPPAGCYGGGYRPGFQLIIEEDPASACTIM